MTAVGELADRLGLTLRMPGGAGGRTGSAVVDGSAAVEIVDVTHDSRRVVPGSLFCCARGEHHDGHDHAADAVANGAVAVLCERPLAVPVPQILSDDVRITMSRAASIVWGDPSAMLKIVGVTGTNGKTTVVSMVTGIMRTAGLRAEMIGTLTGERTTPESTDLQRILAGHVEEGVECVAIEVSSHALVQHRVADVHFDVAIFTNLGRDHLDFHVTQEAYFAAKSLLFEPELARMAVVNVDDVHGRLLHDARNIPMVAVSMADATGYSTSPSGSDFSWRGHRIQLPMIGVHNVSNALLAATACIELGVPISSVVAGLDSLEQVPGRFEVISPVGPRSPGLADLTAVVDYAHTPDALEATLVAARQTVSSDGRVIVVFGCGGDRDREKRSQMGAVAAAGADVVVVTSDNPRSEDPVVIIDQIVTGFDRARIDESLSTELLIDPDRRSAIERSLLIAEDGDVVVVAGKGHETGQTIGSRTEPFDDRAVVTECLRMGVVR